MSLFMLYCAICFRLAVFTKKLMISLTQYRYMKRIFRKNLSRISVLLLAVMAYITYSNAKTRFEYEIPRNHKKGRKWTNNLLEIPFEFSDESPQFAVGDLFYKIEDQSLLKIASKSRYVFVDGFQFCDMLNNATFDSLVQIKPLKGSIAEKNPDISTFINAIDMRAYDIYRAMLRKNQKGDKMDVKRMSCFAAAEGHGAFTNLTETRLLHKINPVNYFKSVLPAIVPKPSPLNIPRQKFKMAYLLMIHELNGYVHAVNLLETLDDGDAIVLIHVDARPKSKQLYNNIEMWVSKREKELGRVPNIHFAKHRFSNIWGHISLVFTQLSGFWELLDMADWDYMINLSNYDYPIKSNAIIHRFLSKYKDKNWIQYWEDTGNFLLIYFRGSR